MEYLEVSSDADRFRFRFFFLDDFDRCSLADGLRFDGDLLLLVFFNALPREVDELDSARSPLSPSSSSSSFSESDKVITSGKGGRTT